MPDKCSENCPLEPRVKALEEENKRHTKTHEEIFRRLNEAEKDNAIQKERYKTIMDKLDGLDKKIDSAMAKANRRIDGVNDDVDALEAKPGKRWDSFGDKVLWFLAEAVLIIAALKIGLM